MGTVADMAKHRKSQETDEKFVGLLDNYCQKEGAVKPLSKSIFDRIDNIKHAVAQAKQRQLETTMLEG